MFQVTPVFIMYNLYTQQWLEFYLVINIKNGLPKQPK